MHIIPDLRLDYFNLWIPLALYFIIFVIFVRRLSKEKREWLFADPKQTLHGWKKVALRIGQLLVFILIILLCLTPIPTIGLLEAMGVLVYMVGVALVSLSLYYFGRAPINQPVLDGPYRHSRNPQWVGLFLVLLGVSILANSILYILLVLLIGLAYHIQILEEEEVCRARFGSSYEDYLQEVPRYLLFK